MTHNHEAIRMLIMSVVSGFRVPNDSPSTAEHLAGMFFRQLSDFSPEVLDKARLHIERHRTDPWMPTVAECVKICEHAKSDKLRDLLDPEGAKKREAGLREIRAIAGPPITQAREPLEEDWVGEYMRSKGKATS